MSKKARKEELFDELADARNEIDYLEYVTIPNIMKELKSLKVTKKEIEENDLGGSPYWDHL